MLESAGDSDHLAVSVTKFTKELRKRPQIVMKRSYKNFDVGLFLQEIYDSDINRQVTAKTNLEDSVKIFQTVFSEILDNHAPVRLFQTRKNYVPYLSNEMKRLMVERDVND